MSKNLIRSVVFLLLIASLTLFLGCDITTEKGVTQFKVQNNTGVNFYGVRVRSSGTTDWGGDLATLTLMTNGTTMNILTSTVAGGQNKEDRYDIQLFQLNSTITATRLNVVVEQDEVISITSAHLDQMTSFQIKNETGLDFCGAYVRPTGTTNWGGDIADDPIPNGATVTINIADIAGGVSPTNQYDIRLFQQLSGGVVNQTATRYAVTVSQSGTVTFTTSHIDITSFRVQNSTNMDFWGVRVRCAGTTDWGDDLAGSTIMLNGTTVNINVADITGGVSPENKYDIRLFQAGTSITATRYEVQVTQDMLVTLSPQHMDNNNPAVSYFHVKNSTSHYFYGGYVRRTGTTDWGHDIFTTMPAGEICTIKVEDIAGGESSTNTYDIRLFVHIGQGYATAYNTATQYNVTVTQDGLVEIINANVHTNPDVTSFQIKNNTGFDFYGGYIKRAYGDDWGSDVCPAVMNNGVTTTVNVSDFASGPSARNAYDIRLFDKDGNTATQYDVVVTQGGLIVLEADDLELAAVNSFYVINATGEDLWGGYVKAAESNDWGDDIFPIMNEGVKATIYIKDLQSGPSPSNTYDIWLFNTGQTLIASRYGVVVTDGMIITLNPDDLSTPVGSPPELLAKQSRDKK